MPCSQTLLVTARENSRGGRGGVTVDAVIFFQWSPVTILGLGVHRSSPLVDSYSKVLGTLGSLFPA